MNSPFGLRRRLGLRTSIGLTATALLATSLTATFAAPASAAGGGTRSISSSGTVQLRAGTSGVDGISADEFAAEPRPDEGAAPVGTPPPAPGPAPRADSSEVKGAGGQLRTSFAGLNMRQQRLANGGNQFSVEPPDQGLCVGNGSVLESANDVLRVFDSAGVARTGVVDLNTFYGYPAQFNRTTGAEGPFVTDPSCLFDRDTQRWFHVVLTLDITPGTRSFAGSNHLDVAVSTTADPAGTWTLYKVPVQDDGTDGTPDHGCSNPGVAGNHGPCIGDYPHIGADANGFYVTTNEYSLNGPEYKAAQLYAFSKRALAAGAATVKVTQIDTTAMAAGNPGFTVWPAIASGANSTASGGTEFFLSSDAAEEANGILGGSSSNRVWLWKLTNTRSLDTATPAVTLTARANSVGTYQAPPKADQKAGAFPLGQCLNDTTTVTPFGPGCWNYFLVNEPAHNVTQPTPDANDTRMQQVTYADGKVWGALDTAVTVGGVVKAGIEAFVVTPSGEAHHGYQAVAGNNLTYPAIGVTAAGKAVVAMTLLGKDHYPSAAFATMDDSATFGPVRVLAEGAGPDDGFSDYEAFGSARGRWGDYGATAVDGGTIWMASEYIAQTCTLVQYLTPPIGSCGGTRVAFGNWATRISQVTP